MKVLLTCGVGDFIALEGYLSARERSAVTEIYWATRARKLLEPLVSLALPNVKQHVVVKDTFGAPYSPDFCVFSAAELPDLLADVVDWSIGGIIDEARSGFRTYNGSTFARTRLADISRLNLPAKYYVVHPYSSNVRTEHRDMTHDEWSTACRLLRAARIPVVIVNEGEELYKKYPGVIDLTNELTLSEALEVTRNAVGFIGASSVFSVLAAKNLSANQVHVKGHLDLQENFAWFYYAPCEDVVVTQLKRSLPKITKLFHKKREIKVHTVQGIGDIFWVYQKLAPHFDVVHFNILCTVFNNVQQRAKEFCKLLPKVGNITFTRVAGDTYEKVAKTKYRLQHIIDAYERFNEGTTLARTPDELGRLTDATGESFSAPYAVNAWLEEGCNLYDIDKLQVEKTVDLGISVDAIRPTGEYLCVFVAGAKIDNIWTTDTWIEVIVNILTLSGLAKVVLIGAEWDVTVQAKVEKELLARGVLVDNYVNELDLCDSVNVIRGSKFFVGYQSGLNIIADNYDVPQLMVYFDQLKPMMYTWCKPENVKTKFFAMTFSDPVPYIPEDVFR